MKGPRQVVERRDTNAVRDSTRPYDAMEHPEKQPRQKRYTPSYRSYQEVKITRRIDVTKERDIADFARSHIAEYKGSTRADHRRIPHMLFERSADARRFADKLHSKFGVPREHIEIKAHRYMR